MSQTVKTYKSYAFKLLPLPIKLRAIKRLAGKDVKGEAGAAKRLALYRLALATGDQKLTEATLRALSSLAKALPAGSAVKIGCSDLLTACWENAEPSIRKYIHTNIGLFVDGERSFDTRSIASALTVDAVRHGMPSACDGIFHAIEKDRSVATDCFGLAVMLQAQGDVADKELLMCVLRTLSSNLTGPDMWFLIDTAEAARGGENPSVAAVLQSQERMAAALSRGPADMRQKMMAFYERDLRSDNQAIRDGVPVQLGNLMAASYSKVSASAGHVMWDVMAPHNPYTISEDALCRSFQNLSCDLNMPLFGRCMTRACGLFASKASREARAIVGTYLLKELKYIQHFQPYQLGYVPKSIASTAFGVAQNDPSRNLRLLGTLIVSQIVRHRPDFVDDAFAAQLFAGTRTTTYRECASCAQGLLNMLVKSRQKLGLQKLAS